MTKKCDSNCGWCAHCQGLELGDTVRRLGDDGNMYDYEVDDIDDDGTCISIINEDANPRWVYIMADDCDKIKNEQK